MQNEYSPGERLFLPSVYEKQCDALHLPQRPSAVRAEGRQLIESLMDTQASAQDGSQALSAVSRCKEVRLDQGGADANGGEVLRLLTTTVAVLDGEQLQNLYVVPLHIDGSRHRVWR